METINKSQDSDSSNPNNMRIDWADSEWFHLWLALTGREGEGERKA